MNNTIKNLSKEELESLQYIIYDVINGADFDGDMAMQKGVEISRKQIKNLPYLH